VANTDRDIAALLDEVDTPVHKVDVEIHLGVAREKVGQHRLKMTREGNGRCDAQATFWHGTPLSRDLPRLFDVFEKAKGTLVKDGAEISEAQAPRRAIEERCSEPVLERLDMLADRSL